jgi:hypothetical protein
MARRAPAWLIAATFALQPAFVPAADLAPQPPKSTPAAAPPAQPASGGAFAPPEVGCLEWNDGCRTCQQPAGGEVVCSNVGLACTPQTPRCTRR